MVRQQPTMGRYGAGVGRGGVGGINLKTSATFHKLYIKKTKLFLGEENKKQVTFSRKYADF